MGRVAQRPSVYSVAQCREISQVRKATAIDYSEAAFRKASSNGTKVCNTGLWTYGNHTTEWVFHISGFGSLRENSLFGSESLIDLNKRLLGGTDQSP